MRTSRNELTRHWPLLLSALLLFIVAWIGLHRRHEWNRSRPAEQITTQTPADAPLDPDLARDPAIEATKVRVGPLSRVVKQTGGAPESQEPGNPAGAQTAEAAYDSLPAHFDRVSTTSHSPVRLCQGRFTVSGSRAFPFQVPPHANFPKLAGHVMSVHGGVQPSVDVLVLDQ